MSGEILTIQNYAEKTRGLKSLAPEWQPTEKNLKANSMIAMYLSGERPFSIHDPEDHQGLSEYLLAHAWNDTKLPVGSPEREAMLDVQKKIGYEFANERLLLQAFTRRSFCDHPFLTKADCEVLELVGDSVLSTVLYRILMRQYGQFSCRGEYGKLFFSAYDEGKLSRIRQKYTGKDYLATRCRELGFDRYIRFGKDEDRSKPDAKEDVMEAVIGAVALDSEWDMAVLEETVEKLLDVHLTFDPWNEEQDDFDLLNTWWQKRFGCVPEYKTERSKENAPDGSALYECELRVSLTLLDRERNWPEWMREKGDILFLREQQGEDIVFWSRRISRSEARSMCAHEAVAFLKAAGLYLNLKDAGIRPDPEDAINQLQILNQRGYVGKAEYEFTDCADGWECICRVDTFWDGVDVPRKKTAKKLVAFAVLIQIMRSAGVDDPEWDRILEDELEKAFGGTRGTVPLVYSDLAKNQTK